MNKILKLNVLIFLILTIVGCKNKFESDPLNILWLVAEDLSPDYLSVYGDSTVHTPNLDKLATMMDMFFDNQSFDLSILLSFHLNLGLMTS